MLKKHSEKQFINLKPFSDVTKFHGHICPGSALGYLAAKAGLRELSSSRSSDEEIVVVVENDSCAVDAVQVVTGCTMGKGNIILLDYGKQAYTFIERKSGDAVRVSLKNSFDINKLEPKLAPLRQKVTLGMASVKEKEELGNLMEEISQKLLDLTPEDLFKIKHVEVSLPPNARIFPSLKCSECGEMVSEHRSRVKKGSIVCIPCFGILDGE